MRTGTKRTQNHASKEIADMKQLDFVKPLDLKEVEKFVASHIAKFHQRRLESAGKMDLKAILKRKNPYLFRAKNMNRAGDLINGFLDAAISSSEEEIFGDFLEDLAIFIAKETYGAEKSPAPGIDFQFNKDGITYIVSVKSGPNWGNSSQQDKQEENFKRATKVLKGSSHTRHVEAILGICYGKTRTTSLRGYQKIVGQNFWYFISGNENLYTDIIKPLGHRAKECNEEFQAKRDALANRLTMEFMKEFCDENGYINWIRLIQLNSGNLHLNPIIH